MAGTAKEKNTILKCHKQRKQPMLLEHACIKTINWSVSLNFLWQHILLHISNEKQYQTEPCLPNKLIRYLHLPHKQTGIQVPNTRYLKLRMIWTLQHQKLVNKQFRNIEESIQHIIDTVTAACGTFNLDLRYCVDRCCGLLLSANCLLFFSLTACHQTQIWLRYSKQPKTRFLSWYLSIPILWDR